MPVYRIMFGKTGFNPEEMDAGIRYTTHKYVDVCTADEALPIPLEGSMPQGVKIYRMTETGILKFIARF